MVFVAHDLYANFSYAAELCKQDVAGCMLLSGSVSFVQSAVQNQVKSVSFLPYGGKGSAY